VNSFFVTAVIVFVVNEYLSLYCNCC